MWFRGKMRKQELLDEAYKKETRETFSTKKDRRNLWLKHGVVHGDLLVVQRIYYWLRWKLTGQKLNLWKMTPHYVVLNKDFLKDMWFEDIKEI